MIEVTQKTTKLEGTKTQLMSEFCCLVKHLTTKDESADEPILTREELDECIRLATLSDDELHREAMTAFVEILGMFGKFL